MQNKKCSMMSIGQSLAGIWLFNGFPNGSHTPSF